MHILFMVFHFPPQSGGAAVVAAHISNALAERGHRITVLVPDISEDGPEYHPNMHQNIKVIRTKTPSRTRPKVAARLCKGNLQRMGLDVARTDPVDAILTVFHPFHLVPNAAIACAKRLGVPCAVKVDDAIYEKAFGIKRVQRWVERIISTQTLKGADSVLVVNDALGKTMRQYYAVEPKKILVVPNGVDLESFGPGGRTRKRKVVFSGVMYNHRGLDMLLESIPDILSSVPDAKFVLMGDGPELEILRQKAVKFDIMNNVTFTGWIPHKKISQEMVDARVAVAPLKHISITDNAVPVKVLEYMASALPMVAAPGTLASDVMKNGHNGYFVNNANELASKIVRLLGDGGQESEKMGANSRRMVQKFSWTSIVKDIESCLGVKRRA